MSETRMAEEQLIDEELLSLKPVAHLRAKAAALLALTLFAVSNRIAVGPHEFGYALPELALKAANAFRASGRMFWPVFYVVLEKLGARRPAAAALRAATGEAPPQGAPLTAP